MKKILLLVSAVTLIFASCSLSNEEKAEALIKETLKGTLYHPESYKPISTRVDSAFINFEGMAKFGEICEELEELLDKEQEYQRKYKLAESLMSIYAPNHFYYTEHERVEYNQHKQECEEYKTKLKKLTPKISSAIRELREVSKNIYTEEFTGWFITHRFTSKNGANTMTIHGEVIFVSDVEFTHCGDGMDPNIFEELFKCLIKISETETDDDLKEILLESKEDIF